MDRSRLLSYSEFIDHKQNLDDMMILFLASTSLFAKDLDGRLGVGVNQILGQNSNISVRFAVPMPKEVMEVQAEVYLGIDTDPNTPYAASIFGLRGVYGIIVEDNMNILGGGAIAYLNSDGSPTFRIQPSIEAQFFLMGLDNLSFSSTIGMEIDFGKGSGQFQLGGNLIGSMHYWF